MYCTSLTVVNHLSLLACFRNDLSDGLSEHEVRMSVLVEIDF